MAYNKPQIVRIGNPVFSKHGTSTQQDYRVMTEIDGVAIDQLISEYGSPLFVFSEERIRTQFQTAKKAFEKRYPKVSFGWSYKTNYLKAICKIFHSEGSLAEVVSAFEYEKARALGIPGSKILFNGPFKPFDALKLAVKEGARIHIDSTEELSDLEEIARETGTRPQVAIRINMDVGIQPQWSRFGFNLEMGQALLVAERIHRSGVVDLCGLHTHIGTFILDPGSYATAVKKLVGFATQVYEKFQFPIRYLDIGGGFASLNHLKGLYQPPEISVPKIDQYAESITSALKQEWTHSDLPELILETGRHLIDEAGYLITSAIASKLLPDSRRAYILDGGVNLLYTSTWYKPSIFLTQSESGNTSGPSVLVGPLCMNIDVVCDSLMLPRLKRGTPLVLHPVGAYNVTQWMQFIQYRPAVVLIRTNGKPELIRRREDLKYVEACDFLPEDI